MPGALPATAKPPRCASSGLRPGGPPGPRRSRARISRRSLAAQHKVRIIQTNSAGNNVHLIDPATNKVVGVINGIEVNHGATSAPDGSRLYISNEADNTLDFVDAKTLKVTNKVPLSGHPNNLAIGRDGRHVYIGIREPEPGGVDVVDTASFKMIKTIPTQGAIHNAYVTSDGKTLVV